MPPRKPKLPDPLPSGLNLTDTEQNTWRVGKMIGQGGFGMIYLASGDVSVPVPDDTAFVAKVEYHENGPLFSELKFYQRAAKQEMINKWKECRRLSFLGIPTYWGSGLFEHNGTRYRFMVIDRLGTDLQKVVEENDGQLKKPTVLQLGIHMLDVLEYIHDHEYVHADIKGANLLLGHSDPSKVYLADYGLSYRYCPNGQHKAYKANAKKGHNGTIEYTSLDAHKGAAPSRRGDLEVLGYCLLHWQCGTLPWLASLRNPAEVQEAKTKLMCNLPGSVLDMATSCSGTAEMARFMGFVKNLGYDEKPDYQALRKVLSEARQQGPLDLSRVRELEPSRPTTQRTANRPKPPDKKTDRSKLAVRAEDEDEEFCASTTNKVQSQIKCETPKQRPHRAAKLRAMQNPKLYTCDEDSSDEDKQTLRQAQTKTRAGPRPVVNQIRTAAVKQDNTDFADVEATMTRRKQNNHQYEDLTLHNNGVEPSSEDDYQKNYSRDHKRREQSEYSGHHWATAVSGRDDKWICRMRRVTGTSGNQPKLSCRSTKHGNILTFFLLLSLAVAFAWAVMK